MTIIFIVVGALGFVGYLVAIPVILGTTSSLEAQVANREVQYAYGSLGDATQTFKAAVQSCGSTAPGQPRLQCLEQADTAWSQALQTYGTTISQIDYPSSAQAAAAQANVAVTNAVSILHTLAASPSLQMYAAEASSTAFVTALNNVDSTYDQLVDTLSNS